MTEFYNRINKLEEISNKLRIKEIEESKYPFLDTLFVFLNHLDTFALMTDCEDKIIFMNTKLEEYFKDLGVDLEANDNKPWWKQLGWEDNPSSKHLITQECIDAKKVIHHKVKSRIIKDLEYDVICIPLKYDGVAAVLSIIKVLDD